MLASIALLLCLLAVPQHPGPRALLVRDGQPAPASARVADDPAAVLDALLAGPNAADRAAGLTTAIPAGTRLVAVATDGDEVVVDLSAAYAGASELAFEQVVKSLGTLGRWRRFTVRTPDAAGRSGAVQQRPAGERPATEGLFPRAVRVRVLALPGRRRSPACCAGARSPARRATATTGTRRSAGPRSAATSAGSPRTSTRTRSMRVGHPVPGERWRPHLVPRAWRITARSC